MGEEMMTNGPTDRLEQKIDALATAVGQMDRRLGSVEGKIETIEGTIEAVAEKIGTVDGKVDTLAAAMSAGFKQVDERLTGVEGQLTDVQKRLIQVEILAKDTNAFSKNAWDSSTSLERRVNEGFEEAKKDRESGFDLVQKAIRYWGQKVTKLETTPTRRPTKRRR